MYKEMVKEAQLKGIGNEAQMHASVERVDELLEAIKDAHPDIYWDFIRDTQESLYGAHYNNTFAEYDLGRLSYTDAEGRKRTGPHWSKLQALEALAGRKFSQGVTDCDKWVAVNIMYSDLCRKFTDAQIIEAAYLFFFLDEDWPDDCKVWEYMNL